MPGINYFIEIVKPHHYLMRQLSLLSCFMDEETGAWRSSMIHSWEVHRNCSAYRRPELCFCFLPFGSEIYTFVWAQMYCWERLCLRDSSGNLASAVRWPMLNFWSPPQTIKWEPGVRGPQAGSNVRPGLRMRTLNRGYLGTCANSGVLLGAVDWGRGWEAWK